MNVEVGAAWPGRMQYNECTSDVLEEQAEEYHCSRKPHVNVITVLKFGHLFYILGFVAYLPYFAE